MSSHSHEARRRSEQGDNNRGLESFAVDYEHCGVTGPSLPCIGQRMASDPNGELSSNGSAYYGGLGVVIRN